MSDPDRYAAKNFLRRISVIGDEDYEATDNQLAAYIDGLRAYAWWKDGTEYVGCGNYTLEQAIARAMEERKGGER